MKNLFLFGWLFACLCCLPALAQDATVSGRVTSSDDGSPLPGVSVLVKGSARGTTTDAQGNYRLTGVPAKAILTFSFVGFKAQDISLGTRNTLSVVLQSDASLLNEVVVTAFGIQRNEREIGGSVARVTTQVINQAAPINVATGLTGKVSGLQINTVNNGVGNNVRIVLRGNRSFLGNNQALLVVDGIITDNSFLSAINPNDIDNLTVLKGPSAAAVYGSDASNGVLVITTKRGTTASRPQISYSNSTQFESISYMPGLQTQFGSNGGEGAPYLDANGNRLYVPFENQSFGPAYDGSIRPLGFGVQIKDAAGNVTGLDTLKVPYAALKKDPRRAFFDRGLLQQHDIAYRVGDKQNYFGLSLQYLDQKGVIPNDKYQRYVVGLKGGRVVDRFTANAGINFTYANTNVAGGDFAQNRPVYWNVLNSPAHADLRDPRLMDINGPFGDVNGYFNAYYPNPWWQVSGENSRQKTNSYTLQGSADVAYKVNDWFNVLYRVGGQVRNSAYKFNRAAVTFSDYALSDPWGAGNIASSNKLVNGQVEDINRTTTRFTGDLLVTLNPKFGDFTTNLVLGNHVQQDYFNYQRDFAKALRIPNLYNISNVIGQPEVQQSYTRSRIYGVFGDLTVGYKNFVFVHGTVRNDWSSLLAASNRSFFYPSVDASVILSDAVPALKDLTWLQYLKIRGGLTKVGSINVGAYELQNTFIPGTNSYTNGTAFPFGSLSGYQLNNRQYDPNLKPEFTTNREVGLEIGFLNRFNLEVAYYKSNTINQTVPIDVSRATGYTSAQINTGEMENQGIEVDLKVRPIIAAGKFRWEVSGNYTYLTSKVLSLYSGLDRLNIPFTPTTGSVLPNLASNVYAAVGYGFPALYVTDIQRASSDASSPYYDKSGQYVGRPVVDANGETILDPTLKYAGTTQPLHRIGLTNMFKYGNFGLNVLWEYRGGAVIYNDVGSALEFTGTGIRTAYNNRQNFVFPNSVLQNTDGSFSPNTNLTTRDGNLFFWTNSAYHQAGSSYVTSADFWRLRELALTYDVPASALEKLRFIRTVNVGLTGRNLLLFRPKTNVFSDPEFSNDNSNATGITNEYQAPPTRFYGFRVSLGF
jgi:TonB-linked SusC/RagA family outer membrane protein